MGDGTDKEHDVESGGDGIDTEEESRGDTTDTEEPGGE